MTEKEELKITKERLAIASKTLNELSVYCELMPTLKAIGNMVKKALSDIKKVGTK